MNAEPPALTLSLQTRLLIAAGLAVLLTLALQAGISTTLYRSLINQYYQQKMQRQAMVLASTLDWWFQISPSQDDRDWVDAQLEGSVAVGYRIRSPQMQRIVLSPAPVWSSGSVPGVPFDRRSLLQLQSPDGPEQVTCVCHGWYVGTARADHYVVQVAVPIRSRDALLTKFWLGTTLSLVLAVTMLSVFGAWVYLNIGRPLARLAAHVRLASPSTLSYVNAPHEIGILSRALDSNRLRAEEVRLNELRFLAIASHELRTPLAALLTQLDHAKALRHHRTPRHGGDVLGPDPLEQATKTVLRLRDLSANLLTLSHPVQSRSLVALDLFTLVGRVVDEWMLFSLQKGVELEVTGETTLVYGNPVGLEQMVTNLVSNALKFTPRGQVTVTVTSTLEGGEISVQDDGIGLPQNWKELLEPLKRGDGLAALIPGSGLGLAVVEQVVRLHGGSLDGHALPEGGSRITVRLPRGSS